MKLGYIVVYVPRVEEVLDFYRAAFALPLRMQHEIDGVVAYGELEAGGAILGFASHWLGELSLGRQYQPVSAAGKPFGQTLVFVADDVRAALARAIGAGATIVGAPSLKPWGQTVAYVRAIEGTLIELCSPMAIDAAGADAMLSRRGRARLHPLELNRTSVSRAGCA